MTEQKKYEVHLDNFDGPMDLLLHLIDKNQLNIYDIPIAFVTEQYLAFLEEAREMDLEIASEFLLVAATLLSIKAKMLLPPRKRNGEDEEPEDPRAELVQRLVEYRFYKETAQLLEEKQPKEVTYMLKPQDIAGYAKMIGPGNPLENISLLEFSAMFKAALEQAEIEFVVPTMEMSREDYSVEDTIEEIRHRLKNESNLMLTSLFHKGDHPRKIITVFLALLELTRLGTLVFRQKESFGPVWLFPTDQGKEVESCNM